MADDAYIGEIRLFCTTWAPDDWLSCDGAILPVSQYQALYSIIGNIYGGDSGRTFKLPDLREKAAMGYGLSSMDPQLGFSEGLETVTLTLDQMPVHTHGAAAYLLPTGVPAAANATAAPVKGSRLSRLVTGANTAARAYTAYKTTPAPVSLAPATIGSVGGGVPHENRQPYLVFNFCICIEGEYPVSAD